jgi:hypothetical protein
MVPRPYLEEGGWKRGREGGREGGRERGGKGYQPVTGKVRPKHADT